MIKKIPRSELGHVEHGWLNTYHHFSFASYFDRDKMGYGPLRVLNDDYIAPNTGFDTHPHENMEIITYVIKGALSHKDSLNNERKVTRGEVQYMSAGTGIFHSEHNRENEELRLLQIWIVPEKKGSEPNYGDHLFKRIDRTDQWLHFVGKGAPISINQDVNFYVTETTVDLFFRVKDDRKLYLVNIEGDTTINGSKLRLGDALISDESLDIKPQSKSHILVIEMKK